jgi:hypothetical protein
MSIFDGIFQSRKNYYDSEIRRAIITLNYSAAGLKDLVFFREAGATAGNYQTYNSINVDQEFNFITIENLSTSRGSYCLETDLSDSITVNLTATDTVKTFEATGSSGSVIEENNIKPAIRRLRMYLDGSGVVNVALYLK